MIKKTSAFFFIFLLVCSFIFAEASFFSFSIKPQFGLMNGIVREYVIDPECANTGNKESQLDWDIKNIPVISADADLVFFNHLYASFNFRSAFSKESGVMQDYDWLNSITTGWLKDDPTELTNYSISDNYLDSYYSLSFRLGGSFNLPLKISLIPFIAFEYNYLAMSSYGGYALYKQYDWDPKYFLDDDGNTIKVISYKQDYNAIMFGLKLVSQSLSHMYLSAEYTISPYTMDLVSLDIHDIRHIAFLDKMYGSLMMQSSASLMYKINSYHGIGLSGFLQYIPFTSGADFTCYVDSSGKPKTQYSDTGVEGGSDRFLWQVSLVYQFSL